MKARRIILGGAAALVLLLLAVVVGLTECHGDDAALGPHTAIVEHMAAVDSPLVVNGTAYDRATLDLAGVRRLVLPPIARVERSAERSGTTAEVRLAKSLGFAGNPPAAMTPRHARRFMGVALQRDDAGADAGATLRLGTYGEWTAPKKGEARLTLHVIVPDGVEVEIAHDETLGGPESVAAGELALQGEPGHWYGSTRPTAGWQPLPTEPDAATAEAERRRTSG